MIHVSLNGKPTALKPCTIAELLQQRGLADRRVAVERNGQIVPRSQHAAVSLHAGDALEIVVAVGGG